MAEQNVLKAQALLNSATGQKATFRLDCERVAQGLRHESRFVAVPIPSEPNAVESASKKPRRVLVVDDNRDAADTLARLLRILGFDAEAVYGGQEAFDAARVRRPHCVLSDIGMPGVDGYHLADLFKRDESLKDIPLIAITAHSERRQAMAAGFDDHFVKPADPYALEETLRKILKMDKRLDQAEQLVQKQGEVLSEAIDAMKEVKDEVKDLKQKLEDVQEDVKEIKEELRKED